MGREGGREPWLPLWYLGESAFPPVHHILQYLLSLRTFHQEQLYQVILGQFGLRGRAEGWAAVANWEREGPWVLERKSIPIGMILILRIAQQRETTRWAIVQSDWGPLSNRSDQEISARLCPACFEGSCIAQFGSQTGRSAVERFSSAAL